MPTPREAILTALHARLSALIRVRIAGHNVILQRVCPEGLSAPNLLSGRVTGIRPGDGPDGLVTLVVEGDRLSARIIMRSAPALALAIGQPCRAVIKSFSVAPEDVGRASQDPAE